MKIFICIPTYNEADNIIKLIDAIKAEIVDLNHTLGLIIIDDNSPDGTGKLVEDYKKEKNDSNIYVIHNPKKAGLGKAYIQGFSMGIRLGADAVMEMDADFSHKPEYLKPIFSELENSDLVIGSRYIRGGGTKNWGFKRKFISRFGNLYTSLFLGFKIKDWTGGFNAYKTKVFEKVDLSQIYSNGYSFQIELKYRTLKAGFKHAEVPIIFIDREFGKSKFGNEIVKEAIKKPITLRFKN